MIVEYHAVDASGREVCDTLEAVSVRSASEELRKRELFVTRIEPKRAARESRTGLTADEDGVEVKLTVKQLAVFTRQMAMLLGSGAGVVPALNSIARQFTKPHHVRMIRRLTLDLEDGATLTDALRRHPSAFDTTYCAIVAAGEASATLPEMFARLAKIVGKRRAMRNKVIGATVYPALLSLLSVGITGVLLFFVLPRFGDMFTTLDVELPASTAFLIALGEGLRKNWVWVALLVVLVVSAVVYGVGSRAGRRRLGELSLQIPLVGRLVAGLIQGETFRVIGMLVEARVGLLEAVDLARGVTQSSRYQRLYDDIAQQVESGGSVSTALDRSGLIPPFICQAVKTGEESGRLGESMTYVADVLDEDNTELLTSLTRLLEPMILIVMGVVVGAVAISLFLPLFDMTSAIGG